MKIQVPKRLHHSLTGLTKTISIITIPVFLFSMDSCKKASLSNDPVKLPITIHSALRDSAYAVLQAKATPEVFNDLDWNNIQISKKNGVPFLLRIGSKSNPSKRLYYGKNADKIHARWVQYSSNPKSAISVAVTSLNGTYRTESTFQDGKIIEAKRTKISGEITLLKLNQPDFSGIKSRLKTNSEDDSDNPDDLDSEFDGGDDGGNITIDNPAWSVTMNQVEIEGDSNTDNSTTSTDFYSLYVLMGYNPDYIYQYTTEPEIDINNPTGSGSVISVAPSGTKSGTDPTFVAGRSPAAPVITYQPYALLYGNAVSIAYTLTTANGATTVNVTTVSAGLVGNTIGVSWTTLTSGTSITSGSIINFSISGTINFGATIGGVGPTLWSNSVSITGTYNTSNGAYVINVR